MGLVSLGAPTGRSRQRRLVGALTNSCLVLTQHLGKDRYRGRLFGDGAKADVVIQVKNVTYDKCDSCCGRCIYCQHGQRCPWPDGPPEG